MDSFYAKFNFFLNNIYLSHNRSKIKRLYQFVNFPIAMILCNVQKTILKFYVLSFALAKLGTILSIVKGITRIY